MEPDGFWTFCNLKKNSKQITSQMYGFSPVWIRMCMVSLSFLANPLPHTVHSNALLVAAATTNIIINA